METNEDKIKYLKTIAESIIVHYLKNNNNFQDEHRLETEVKRIHSIIEEATITIKNYIPGSPTKASNGTEGIILYVKDKDNVSIDELNSFIEKLIHEFYHSISRVNPKIDNIFLEEGYVTEITAETIRYVINNPIDIGNIKKEELVTILKEQILDNAYINPSEFVRSTQVIMQNFGYNGMLEYMFSEDGVTRICEIADDISPEFGDIMKKQNMKAIGSTNYVYEQNFFLKMFEKTDFTNVSETSIEMNWLLQSYLTDQGLIYENPRLYDIVSKYNVEYVDYKEFYKKNNDLPRNELFSKIKIELDKFDFEYQTQDNRPEDAKRMDEIINGGYEQSTIKPNMFLTCNYFAELIAYDMYLRGLKTPTDKDVEEYSNYLVYESISEKILIDMVLSGFDKIYQESESGKKISEIINQSIANQALFVMSADKESENLTYENYWEKIENVADMVAEQKEQNGESFYTSFYLILLKMTKKYIDTDKVYNQNDYEEFKSRMSQIFNKAGVPIDVMNEIGMTPDKLFLKAISEKMNFQNRTEQTIALLEIAKNSMTLGNMTNDLQDFTMNISTVYKELKNGDNQELLEQYINTLLEAYYKTLKESTTVERRKSKYNIIQENAYIKEILEDLVLSPRIYRNPNTAREMFEKYPEFYQKTKYNKSFYKMLIRDLPEDKQEELNDKDIYGEDIKEAVIGKKFSHIEDITPNKLEQIGDIAKFYIVYDKYQELRENGDTNKAKKFWGSFYEQEKINAETRSLYNETLQLINESPEEVNTNSIKGITTQFKDAILERDDKPKEVKGR